jgi:DNA-binding CsgD family transcriptional regulator
MNEFERIKYEELYRKCWVNLLVKDKQVNPKLERQNRYVANGNKGRAGRAMGDRPKQIEEVAANKLPLTKDADMVNRMIFRGMTLVDIAEILSISPRTVGKIKKQFGLPR